MTDFSEIEYENAGKFLSNEEAAADLLATMDVDAREGWQEINRDELIRGHHGCGTAIRNYYLMWHPENPYSKIDSENEELHPDTRSMLVMEAVWDAINKVT